MWRKAADLVKLPTFFDCMNISEVTGAGGLVSELRPVEFIMQERCDFKRWLRSAKKRHSVTDNIGDMYGR